MAEEIEQLVGLAAARAEMHVRDEKRAKAPRDDFRHGAPFSSSIFMLQCITSFP
jgi:hypothetical protein